MSTRADLAPLPQGVIANPCKRCAGTGRIVVIVNGQPPALHGELICCHCGGRGEARG